MTVKYGINMPFFNWSLKPEGTSKFNLILSLAELRH